ncbi:thioredoxin domain-containing protein [Candidatus Kaiserbacteria bacterium]|nr:thioredoxin domain-containing protein [Candidatus Kaiserbacteria bacterium]
MARTSQTRYGIPIAIVIAGLLIAGAVILPKRDSSVVSSTALKSNGEFRMPNETDHVRGNPDAPIAIVEFSDLECPFCARLHPTLKQIVAENSDVRWIYRHFPLSTIHSRALSAAVASECIAQLGTNENFWSFTDLAFENQRQLDNSWYEEVAVSFGINSEAFSGCISDRGVVADIQKDFREATDTGGRGTPYVVVVAPDGQLTPFSGALPYQQIAALVEQVRNN